MVISNCFSLIERMAWCPDDAIAGRKSIMSFVGEPWAQIEQRARTGELVIENLNGEPILKVAETVGRFHG